MTFLLRVDSFLNKLEGGLLILLLALMVLLAFLQVVLRNFFAEGIFWADILLRHLVLWVGFLGAALATSEERHIGIDAFSRMFSARTKAGVRIVTNLFALTVSYLLFNASKKFLQFEREDVRELFLGIPEWYSALIIPVGFGLIMVHFLIRAITSAETVFKKAEK